MTTYFVIFVLVALVAGLASGRLSSVKSFSLALAALYFTGVVSSELVLSKATNIGLITLLVLILASIGLERLTSLATLANRLLHPSLPFDPTIGSGNCLEFGLC